MGFGRARAGLRVALPAALLVSLLTGCEGQTASGPDPTTSTTATPLLPSSSAQPPATSTPDTNGATAAPAWLGTRVLATGSNGFGAVNGTPPELRNRRIISQDRLPPPEGGRFHYRITQVPAAVAARSTWAAGCPVKLSDLRYVNVSFVGFDGWAHTGELLLNHKIADDVVLVFRELFAVGWPIEEMRITSPADVAAPSTGDGNNTSAFVCRDVRGASTWSQHAYGLAIDVNPFHNPYIAGRTVLPELAKSYADRGLGLPGMNTRGSAPVRAFDSIGWGWGGDYSSKKDWMHFSSTGK